MENIFLCGFMGTGKTHVGKRLAKTLQVEFFDIDKCIVAKEGCSIPAVFEKCGEARFREIETQVLLEVSRSQGCVIATGGGILSKDENATIIKNSGTLFYLNTPFTTCYNRIKFDKNRPLAVTKSREELYELYIARHKLYMHHADVVVHTTQGIAHTITKIKEAMDSR